jgi:hypothetical protein
MKPVINSSTSRSELGLNHVQLAGYLCPVESVKAFNENTEEYIYFLTHSSYTMFTTIQ